MKQRLFLLLSLVLGVSLLATLLYALSISSVSLTPLNATTQDVLTCSWSPSGDTTQQNVTWYNGSNVHSLDANIAFSNNYSILSSGVARKGETWTCSIALTNGTFTNITNTSLTIQNAAPIAPNATNESFYEDQAQTLQLTSSDPDNDSVSYSLVNLDYSPFYCSIGASNGSVSCLPSQTHIGNTSVQFIASDLSLLSGQIVTYEVISVNDPPSFSISDQNATEDVLFNLTISVTDEENNTPFNFTLNTSLSSLQLVNYSATQAYLTFNRGSNAPVFAEQGVWNVTINVTDTGSNNATPYDQNSYAVTFTLNITSVNQEPNITTNLSGISGTQGSLLYFAVNATDLDVNDTLNFSITSNCSLTNPWSITTTNSSSNATGVVNITLTNDHVVCRYVNISVTDSQDTDVEQIFLNITNINDQPIIYNLSYSVGNSGNNISNLTAVKDLVFIYSVNGSDVDSLTYASEVLTYTDNTSLFAINSSTGYISFTPGDGDVGNHTVLINVSDDEGLWYSEIMEISVINSSAPQLNLVGDFSCTEDSNCQRFFTANDSDPGETLTYASNNSGVFSISSFNSTTGNLNYTPTNTNVGNYTINVTVTDQHGFTDSEIFTFSVNNANDAPFFDQNNDDAADTVAFTNIVEDIAQSFRINVTDDDLTIGLDSLSYNYTFLNTTGNLDAITSISSSGSDYFVISFTPNGSHVGNHSMNLSVNDSANARYSQVVNFTVLAKTVTPTINTVRPYYISGTNTTVFTFGNSSLYPTNSTPVYVNENTTVAFDAVAVNDSSVSGNFLTYYWYVDNVLNTTLENVNPSVNSSLDYDFDFFSSGSHTIRLVVQDERFSQTNWSWSVEVNNTNRAVEFLNPLDNLSINGSLEVQDYFSYRSGTQRFYDPDDDLNSDGQRGDIFNESGDLTYALSSGSSCSFATFSFDEDDITVSASSVGTCFVNFTATDPYGLSATSSTVRVTLAEAQTVPTPTSSSSSGGGGSSSRTRAVPFEVTEPEESPYPIQLVVPEEVSTFPNNTIQIPITIENTWNDTLSGINLNASIANLSEEENITFSFTTGYVASLNQNENITSVLTVGNYRLEEPYTMTITASVENPEYSDSAIVLISSLERVKAGDDVQSKVNFARDLLNDNPECQELNELLIRAEEEEQNRQYDKALTLVNSVINGCKYLINQQIKPVDESPKSFFSLSLFAQRNMSELLIGGSILVILVFFSIVMVVTGRRAKKDSI